MTCVRSVCSLGPPVTEDTFGVGRHDEQVGSGELREQLAREVLVDHCLDADERTGPVRQVGGRDSAAAGADDDRALLQEPDDRIQLEDPLGLRRCDDPAPRVTVLLEDPAALRGVPLCGDVVIARADELGGVVERRIVGVDLDHGEQRRDRLLEREQVAEFLLDHVADHSLGPRTQNVERIGVSGVVRRGLERQEADLRPVPVREHQLVLECQGRQLLRCHAHVGALGLRGHRVRSLEQGVAAQCHDDPHIRSSRQAADQHSPPVITVHSGRAALHTVPRPGRTFSHTAGPHAPREGDSCHRHPEIDPHTSRTPADTPSTRYSLPLVRRRACSRYPEVLPSSVHTSPTRTATSSACFSTPHRRRKPISPYRCCRLPFPREPW